MSVLKVLRIFKNKKSVVKESISKQLHSIQKELDQKPRIFLLSSEYTSNPTFKTETIYKGQSLEDLLKTILSLCTGQKSYTVDSNLVVSKAASRRTVSALYRLAKEYIEDVSLEDVYKALKILLVSKEIGSFICGDIKKRVYFKVDNVMREAIVFYSSEDVDEYNYKHELKEYYIGYGYGNTKKDLVMHKTTIQWE